MGGLAAGTEALHLDDLARAGEAEAGRTGLDRRSDVRVVHLGRHAAIGADQELPGMGIARIGAADEGIGALEAVDQTLGEQEVEGAIDGGRRGAGMIGAEFWVKLLISGGLIVPLGFIMGMPFPTGLRAMSELGDRRVEWAWALNGAATVLGSVSAMILAVHFGLNVTLMCGAAAYLLAASRSRSFRHA